VEQRRDQHRLRDIVALLRGPGRQRPTCRETGDGHLGAEALSQVEALAGEADQFVRGQPGQVVGQAVSIAMAGQARDVDGIAPRRQALGQRHELGRAVGKAMKEDHHPLGAPAWCVQPARATPVQLRISQLCVNPGADRGDARAVVGHRRRRGNMEGQDAADKQ
jgi:hypothetical protein